MKETNQFKRLFRAIIPRRESVLQSYGESMQISEKQADQSMPLDFEHTAVPPLNLDTLLILNNADVATKTNILTWKAQVDTQAFNCPKEAADILEMLDLNIAEPMKILYAINYIGILGYIQFLRNSPKALEKIPEEKRGKEIKRKLKDLAIYEKPLPRIEFHGLSRKEIIDTRQEVEEAFRTHPKVYRTLL